MEQINFNTLENIFNNESKLKLSSEAKMFYTSCLFNEFLKRKENGIPSDTSGFFIEKSVNFFDQINIDDLNRAGLVSIDTKIHFYPLWLKYLPSPLLAPQIKTIKYYLSDLQSQSFKETICMKNSITISQCDMLIENFVKEQDILKSIYNQPSEALRHCANWIAKQPKNKNISSTNKL